MKPEDFDSTVLMPLIQLNDAFLGSGSILDNFGLVNFDAIIDHNLPLPNGAENDTVSDGSLLADSANVEVIASAQIADIATQDCYQCNLSNGDHGNNNPESTPETLLADDTAETGSVVGQFHAIYSADLEINHSAPIENNLVVAASVSSPCDYGPVPAVVQIVQSQTAAVSGMPLSTSETNNAPASESTAPLISSFGTEASSTVASTTSTVGPTTSTAAATSAGQGLIINLTYDSSVSSAPSGFQTALSYVVNFFETTFSNPITININVGYGEINGQQLASNALGESEASQYVPVSYSSVRSALQAQGAPGSSTLPSSSPVSSNLNMSQAEGKALGLYQNDGSLDGYVGFSSTLQFNYTQTATQNQYYFIGVVEHEISEVLGRVSFLSNFYSPMDFYRYSSPGVRDLVTGGTAYFSIDNGTTNLGTWNNQSSNGDLGDWYPNGPAPGGNDAFNDYTKSGVINVVSANDIILMNALGWTGSASIQPIQPTISAVAESPSSGDLNAGKSVFITLTLSSTVMVSGAPTLSLNDGGTANYSGGSGTNTLKFNYTVGANDSNVPSLAVTAVNLNGGTIQDGGGNNANLLLGSVTQSGPQIDTTAPTVASIAASGAGITNGSGDLNAGKVVTLTVTMSELVTVAGNAPTLALNDGGTATYTGGSGTNALTFSYTVAASQNTNDLIVSSFNPNGATITDGASNNANVLGATNYNPAGIMQIDTTAPTVASIAASGPGITNGSGDLNAGKVVTLTVTMSELVTVASGTPILTLNDGGTATYTSGSGTNALTFSYTVAASQNTDDLIVSSFNLNGATITDGASNNANVLGATNYNPAGILQIDTTAPTSLSLSAVSDTGATHANAGHQITIAMTTSEVVTVTGTPTLQLNDNEVATYTNGSGTNTLTFTYMVQSGDVAADLQVTGLNLPTGTSIHDAVGNNLSGLVAGDLGLMINMATFPFTGDAMSQIEAIYIGYFGRAGDPLGTNYWTNQLLNGGATVQSMTGIAASYSVQPEAQAQYPFLANPSGATTSGAGNQLDQFINSVYQNLFGRAADGTDTSGGLGYWRGQILNVLATHDSTALANELGSFILQVAYGAQGQDQTVLANKVSVADAITQTFSAHNIQFGTTADQFAHADIASVTASAASVTAADIAIIGIINSLI